MNENSLYDLDSIFINGFAYYQIKFIITLDIKRKYTYTEC